MINALLGRSIPTIALLASSGVVCIALILLYTRRLHLSIIVLLSLFIALTASLQFIGRGAHDTVTSLYATVIVIGSLLLNRRAFIAMVAVILLVIAGIVTAETYGWTRSPYDGEPGDWFDLALILGLTAFASRLLSESLQRSRALARKNAEALEAQAAALRASEERYRILAANLPDSAVLILDHDLRFVLADGPELAATGYSKEALEGRLLYEAIPASFAAQVEGNIRAVLSGKRFSAEIPYEDRIYYYHYVPLIDDSGRVKYAMILALNVTERRRAQAERERLIAELEQKNAELERFTYTVSHDLKSPLITIQGFLGYLERDLRAGNTERMQNDIQRIDAAVRKMERLLNDLLELSRIGRLSAAPQHVPFNEIVQEALELLAGRIAERQARISVAPDMPIVYGDRDRLVEIVQNLVDNALKFCDNQRAPDIEIGVIKESSGSPIFFVRDNGIGIDPKYHEQIFGLFNKLDPRSEGTGVGLTIVRRIIEVHGGRIWVESAGAGAGATFYFSLPVAPVLIPEMSNAQSAPG
ncbi:MAG: ATP-binding protein [Roseiflexaceae bacterium]|nr:ATP-binding protein [Roseiflexus sp.]MDW8212041.1 ATP-binding protein [Roseiflexaceae bacterium]